MDCATYNSIAPPREEMIGSVERDEALRVFSGVEDAQCIVDRNELVPGSMEDLVVPGAASGSLLGEVLLVRVREELTTNAEVTATDFDAYTSSACSSSGTAPANS